MLNRIFHRNDLIKNIFYSGIEQGLLIIAQFVASILIVRSLPRDVYGLLGVVTGYFVFFNIFNITVESVILKDIEKFGGNIRKIIEDFISVSLLKLLFIAILSALLAGFLFYWYSDWDVVYAVGISYVVLGGQALVSPLLIYFSSKYDQKLVTKVSFIRTIIRMFLLIGIYYFNSLKYYFIVELAVNIVFCCIWFYLAFYKLNIDFMSVLNFKNVNWQFIKKTILGYSLWIHLNGVVTNFLYRSDTFFLSMFVGFREIGNYSISLNSSSIANIVPSILGYQNSIALNGFHESYDIERITNVFLKISIYIGILTMLCFLIFGIPYLVMVTGDADVDEIYVYMILIVLSLIIVKTISSPLVSVISMKGDVNSFFRNVSLPLFFVVCITYFFGAYILGTIGVAIANLCNSFIWLILVYIEFKKTKFKINYGLNIKADLNLLLKILKK